MEQAILVYVDLEGVPIHVGRLWGHFRNGRESMSFEYSHDWLSHPKRFSLDPEIKKTEIDRMASAFEHEDFCKIA